MSEAKAAADVDPLLFLLMASVNTAQKELGIQAGVADVSNKWSQGALANVQVGDAILTSLAAAVTAADSATLPKAQAAYQVAQTQISNNNQNYSNIVQGGTTAMTSLTQVQAQVLQFCQIIQANMDAINNLISSWSG